MAPIGDDLEVTDSFGDNPFGGPDNWASLTLDISTTFVTDGKKIVAAWDANGVPRPIIVRSAAGAGK